MLILHSFHLSLATYRVRVALNLKGVAFEERAHDLTKGEQNDADFRAFNPAGAVPALQGATPEPLTQSLAILEWLEETHPEPALLPADAAGRARVRSLFLLTAADTHPIVVPRVRQRLAQQFGADEAAHRDWSAHWFRWKGGRHRARHGSRPPRGAGEAVGLELAFSADHTGHAVLEASESRPTDERCEPQKRDHLEPSGMPPRCVPSRARAIGAAIGARLGVRRRRAPAERAAGASAQEARAWRMMTMRARVSIGDARCGHMQYASCTVQRGQRSSDGSIARAPSATSSPTTSSTS